MYAIRSYYENSDHTCWGHPEKFDVIVVMGAAVWPSGVPSPALKRRLDHGVFLWQKRYSENLLLTGGTGRFPPAEALVMRRLALAAGVPVITSYSIHYTKLYDAIPVVP